MIAAEPEPPTTEVRGGGSPSPPGPPPEVVLLRVDRCAILGPTALADLPSAGLRGSDGPRVPVRTVASLGLEARIRERQRQVTERGPAARGAGEASDGWAHPAVVILTERALSATGTRGGAWWWSLAAVTEVVHSASEPCTLVRHDNTPDHGVVVPPSEVARFRAALDDALEQARGEAPAPSRPAGGTTVVVGPADGPAPARRRPRAVPGFADRAFRGGSLAAGMSVLVIMVLVGLFLLVRATSALKASGLSFLTTSEWQPDTHRFGIAAVLTGTILIALVALAVSIPLATGTALFISEVAPRRLRQTFISMVDLMAAVPSVVYGLWGFKYLQGHVLGLSRWLSTWFGWVPVFKVTGADPANPLATASVYTASAFIAGLVVALMVIPISCSIMREVFGQAPAGEREGAYALGATRWGMIRSVVLPFGKGGMIGAVMLGLGRALGETIAVVLIISPLFAINWHILQTGANSVSSLIVLRVGDASGFGLSALMAAGLALFVLTLIVNFSAAVIVSHSRSGAESEA